MQQLKSSFAPVVDGATRVLLLGSLPGDPSLAAGEYYANPRNRFWHLAGAVIGDDLVGRDYAARLKAVRAAGLGLWDVVGEAVREGSLDSAIRRHRANDLASLARRLPRLVLIAFNGGAAARLGQRALAGTGVEVPLLTLPSSSPAHAIPHVVKLESWLTLRPWLGAPS